MPRNDLILFLDLETTGVDENLDNIIEVGIAVYNWPEFREVDARSFLVAPSQAAFERMQGKEVVRDMHAKNGLTADIEKIMADEIQRGDYTHDAVDGAIDQWLSQFGSRGSAHIPLAGSGVGHFDRKFIKRYLPLLNERLTHWNYDVGVLRRMFILAGARPAPDDAKTHRALDDARVHATEFVFYMNTFKRLLPLLAAEAVAPEDRVTPTGRWDATL